MTGLVTDLSGGILVQPMQNHRFSLPDRQGWKKKMKGGSREGGRVKKEGLKSNLFFDKQKEVKCNRRRLCRILAWWFGKHGNSTLSEDTSGGSFLGTL